MEAVILKKDNLKLGMLLGFLAPILGVLGYYYFKFYPLNVTLKGFWNLLMDNRSFLTGISSIALIANAVLFTIYINTHKDKTAKGIFVITLIYGIAVLLFKVVR